MGIVNNKKNHNRGIVALGIIGVVLFFLLYPGQHPHRVVNIEHPKKEIIANADSILRSWNYSGFEQAGSANLASNYSALDSLQRKWGKKAYQERLSESEFLLKDILYSWTVTKREHQEGEGELYISMNLSTSGNIIRLDVSDDVIQNQRPSNRAAIRYVLQNRIENFSRDLEDSLVSGLVDYQHLGDGDQYDSRALDIINRLRELRGGEPGDVYTNDNIWQLANFYLQQTAWKKFELQQDSIVFKDDGGFQSAIAHYSGVDNATGFKFDVSLELLPAGSLKSLNYNLQTENRPRNDIAELAEVVRFLFILAFCIWLLVVFYLRIKAKAIDTKPAIIVAVLAGFVAPAYILLYLINEADVYISLLNTSEIINSLMLLAVFGAISAVIFFVLTAVSDSITRQYFPKKLKTWDLIRRGIFKNKPIGWVIVNGFSIGGILAGIWVLFLIIFPSLQFSTNLSLVSDTYVLAPLANMLASTFIVLLIVVIIFLILANQIAGLTGNNWMLPIIGGIIFGFLEMAPANLEPWYLDGAINFIIGFTLGYFYLKFDFLTTALGAFMFVSLLLTEEGWLISNSPDATVFYFFIALSAALIVIAIFFVNKGTEREELPEYIPAYIEEQATEQRIKQELSIARVVQQTFLPSKIKRLPGIDIAGACIPAQETGGDYYDMIPLGENRTAVAIGDVSGKGIRAAFYMTFVKGVLHSLSPLILSPVELLNQLNRLFHENATRGTFISMIYGVLEADKRQLTFARAGHNPMLVVRKNGDTEWLQPKGIGIGVINGDRFLKGIEESTLKLKEGDVIVLYTDGITEMLSTGRRFYGEERLERLVKKVKNKSSEKILQIIIDDVNEFKGLEKQHDDMTLMIIKADASVSV